MPDILVKDGCSVYCDLCTVGEVGVIRIEDTTVVFCCIDKKITDKIGESCPFYKKHQVWVESGKKMDSETYDRIKAETLKELGKG